MPLNQTAVPLQPRKASGCLDVAVKFYSRHLVSILEVVMTVGLPAVLLTYLLTWRLDQDFRLTVFVLHGATWFAEAMIVAGAARALFGQSFFPREIRANRRSLFGICLLVVNATSGFLLAFIVLDIVADVLGSDFLAGQLEMVWYVLLLAVLSGRLAMILGRQAIVTHGFAKALSISSIRRIALAITMSVAWFPANTGFRVIGYIIMFVMFVPNMLLSFYPESIIMSSIDEELRGRGIRSLLKSEWVELIIRDFLICSFGTILGYVFFFTADQAFTILLAYPIFIGRLSSVIGDGLNWDSFVIVFRFLFSDPRCLTVLTGSVLLAYPIVRLAWFFCYIDLRVRRDCWDIELSFQEEARRLEGVA